MEAINLDSQLPLVVIMGPTASGKTKLAIELAEQFNGEIICADSRTIYADMNIGTAKPTEFERKKVQHWGLDLINPNEKYSAAEFKSYADQKIIEIRGRGHVPFLVGGSGLYIDSVLFDFEFGKSVDEKMRLKLQQMSLNELTELCNKQGITLPENHKNKRYVIRAIENRGVIKNELKTLKYNSIVVGITTDKSILNDRIEQRIDNMVSDGVIEEGEAVLDKYGWDCEPLGSGIYNLIKQYLKHDITLDELKQNCAQSDRRLAKKQITWMKRNKFIHWFSLSDAKIYISQQLAIANKA